MLLLGQGLAIGFAIACAVQYIQAENRLYRSAAGPVGIYRPESKSSGAAGV